MLLSGSGLGCVCVCLCVCVGKTTFFPPLFPTKISPSVCEFQVKYIYLFWRLGRTRNMAAVGLCPRLEPALVIMTRFSLFILNCVVHVISNLLTKNTDHCKDVANGYNSIIYSIKSRFQQKTKQNLYTLAMTTNFSYWSLTFCVQYI